MTAPGAGPSPAEERFPGLRAHVERIGTSRGWRRAAVAIIAGLCAAAALPPFHVLPLLIPAFGILFILALHARRVRDAARDGWWFGLGFFTAGLYWIAISLFVDDSFIWMLPFVTLGLAGLQAIFPAGAAAFLRWSEARGWPAIFVLASGWVATEWLRGLAFSGFPWNLIGTVWTVSDAAIQGAALAGVLGLSLVTVLAATGPVLGILPAAVRGPRPWTAAAGLLLLPGLLWAGGMVRLHFAGVEPVPGVKLRIVQPNIPQDQKWQRAFRDANFRKHVTLTRAPGYDSITHVIWPEAAVPFFLELDGIRRVAVAELAPAAGAVITGSLRAGPGHDKQPRAYNSLLAIDRAAGVASHYDKHHLVPFGEYIPYREWLKPLGLEKIAGGTADYSKGPGPRTVRVPGLPLMSPLICYEVIFSGQVAPKPVPGTPRPEWLLNLTNDGWFGQSTGPYQHFAAARLRAVEEGLPLVRAANTGISAFIDPYGRVVQKLGLGERGVLDGALLKPIEPATLFSRYGQWTPLFLALLAGLIGRFAAYKHAARER